MAELDLNLGLHTHTQETQVLLHSATLPGPRALPNCTCLLSAAFHLTHSG